MVEISMSGSGEGLGWATGPGYSTSYGFQSPSHRMLGFGLLAHKRFPRRHGRAWMPKSWGAATRAGAAACDGIVPEALRTGRLLRLNPCGHPVGPRVSCRGVNAISQR